MIVYMPDILYCIKLLYMIPCQMDHFLGMILDHLQICSRMRGPRVFFSLEVWDGGKGQGIVLFAGGGGAYFWFISNKF